MDEADVGKHTVAAVVSQKFLTFTKSRGNDLSTSHGSSFPGLKDGDRWCLCVSRWKEAYDARGEQGEEVVPKVVLRATNKKALDVVPLQVLEQYAIDGGDHNNKQEL
eukprot:TRINITY_DN1486_c0_g1_i1.p2 TRINITY_DN1486_c0_g1~~TRINITY_DN1486_c0_g1_i1.p2  ORF type:complete len:107 (+),score=30.89 TRINITY_DN1486_c0_g1_i1:323-643(+)